MSCRLRLLVVLFVLSALAAPAAAQAAPRVTNGTKVTRGDFDARWSSIVSIRNDALARLLRPLSTTDQETHNCGGVLVRPDIVLTAAHCVSYRGTSSDTSLMSVMGGTRRLGAKRRSYGSAVRVQEIVVHPSYGSTSRYAEVPAGLDLALLKLARPIPGTTTMRVVGADEAALWGAGSGLQVGARVAGWGLTTASVLDRYWFSHEEEGERTPPGLLTQEELRTAALPILPDRICESTDSGMGSDAPQFARATMLCGGTRDTKPGLPSTRKGACSGDSGGPLAVATPGGEPRLVGIVSWGPSTNGPCNRLSVFARVDAGRPWIEQVVAQFDSPSSIEPPRRVTAETVGLSALRATWSDATGDVVRQRLVQDTTLLEGDGIYDGLAGWYVEDEEDTKPLSPRLKAGLARLHRYSVLAQAGRDTTTLRATGIAPVKPGSTRRIRLRVEVRDSLGRTELSKPFVLRPAIDAKVPGTPVPKLVSMRRGVPSFRWAHVRDNDCVLAYIVQARGAGAKRWKTIGGNGTNQCFPGDGYYEDEDEWASNRWTMYETKPGTYAMRVVALDRAGNGAPSRTFVARVPKYVEDIGLEDECDLRGERVICNYPADEY